MGGRKIKHLTLLQRPFALNLCKAYRITATSSATVLAGLIPLHIRAEQKSVYTTLIYLRKDATLDNITYSPLQFQSPGNTFHSHPARKGTGISINISRIQPLSVTRVSRDTQIYTDGSKQEDGVGSAFAHYDKGRIIHVWKGRLDLNKSVLQADVQAIITAVDYIFNNNIERAKIFTDCMSTLLALDNHNHTSPLIIKLQQLLQRNPQKHLSLTWIKEHAENEGNEAADSLAKQAATDENITIPALLPTSKGYYEVKA
ncbi:uncharacterized protein LOC118191612 [Stegodyphus dumicola]|uniref:uncharacterized protein LOC118191612 n=1 Tax=Stegodyphus dumicola TaxID=202533 RepID=UPI0015B0A54E|nr:uncharacterized protein LOC118191612 [Stegodyphus dumicola]